MALLLLIILTISVIYFLQWYSRHRKIVKCLEKYNGPRPLPIIGNTLELLSDTDLLTTLLKFCKEGGAVTKLWIGPTPGMLIIQDYKLFEFLFTSTKAMSKSSEYTYLKDWIGTGLLTNNGDAKWYKHRKLLTPTLGYNVIGRFIPTFSSICSRLLQKLENEIGNPSFDVATIMQLYTLDTICECVMGTSINALEESDSEFVQSVAKICDVFMKRTFNLFLQSDILFRLTQLYKEHKKALTILNDTVDLVIIKRKQEMQENNDRVNVLDETDNIGSKRRLALLDSLLDEAEKDPSLTNQQIREEVGTFLFAGHDTTHVTISFCLYSLAENKHIQDKVVEELRDIFENDTQRPITLRDLNEMKYLEAVIKETLRLYPSVPFHARTTTEDLEYGGGILPKGVTLLLFGFAMHRNPEIYPNPLTFDPERFISGIDIKNPYAYVPFSAGPRDCIGKKFAMILLKFTLATLLRRFEVFPSFPKMELKLISEAVLKSQHGVHLRIENRNF